MNSNVKHGVPFLWVFDMEKSLAFYVRGLGFRITESWKPDGKLRWCSLTLGGASLMLQEFWKEGPHKNVPNEKLGVGVILHFMCADALEIYRNLTKNGIAVSEPFVGNHMWVTSLRDPDGYQLVFESPTHVAEETRYSKWAKS